MLLFYQVVAIGHRLDDKSFVTASSTPAEVLAAEAKYCLENGVPKVMVLAYGCDDPEEMAKEIYPDEETFKLVSEEDEDGLYEAFVSARELARARLETHDLPEDSAAAKAVGEDDQNLSLDFALEGLKAVGCELLYPTSASGGRVVSVGADPVELLDRDGQLTLSEGQVREVSNCAQRVDMARLEAFDAAMQKICADGESLGAGVGTLLPYLKWFGVNAENVVWLTRTAKKGYPLVALVEYYNKALVMSSVAYYSDDALEMNNYDKRFRFVVGIGLLLLLYSEPPWNASRADNPAWLALRELVWCVNAPLLRSSKWRKRFRWGVDGVDAVTRLCGGFLPVYAGCESPSLGVSAEYLAGRLMVVDEMRPSVNPEVGSLVTRWW